MNRWVIKPKEGIEQPQLYPGFISEQEKENRYFPRYKIKRRILIKDSLGNVLTGHAFDISRQGLQFRCSTKVAYQLATARNFTASDRVISYEVKIALPYMNELTECGIHCSVKEITTIDNENMRIGLSFLFFDNDSQSRLDHFIDNLTL